MPPHHRAVAVAPLLAESVLTQFCVNGRQTEIRLGCVYLHPARSDNRAKICKLKVIITESTCKDGLSGMRDFPSSDSGRRQVPPRRVRPLVCRQRAQPRGGGQTLGLRQLMGSRARASSPSSAAFTGPITHRKRLQQRGHLYSTILCGDDGPNQTM